MLTRKRGWSGLVVLAILAAGLVLLYAVANYFAIAPPSIVELLKQRTSLNEAINNFKQDQASLDGVADSLTTSLSRDAKAACKAIVLNARSHNHAYYIFTKKLIALNSTYSKYQADSSYISDRLNEDAKTLAAVKADCLAVGVKI